MNSPFNEAKYKALLEGLEATEITLSNINDELRIDSEYFAKNNLALEVILQKIKLTSINDFAYVTDGIHTAIDYCEKSKVNLISATSPRENFFDISRQVFISDDAHKENPRTALKHGDVIISTVGTIGNCAVVDKSILPANSDRHVGIIRIKEEFSPYFLSTFLLTKYGRFQTTRESTGNVQLNLFLYKIRNLIIPYLTINFQQEIERLVKESHKILEKSKELQKKAEQTLLSVLGLENWQPTQALSYERKASDVFTAERFDAEYFYPEKAAALAFLEKLPGKPVRERFKSIRNLWQPDTAPQNQQVQNYDLTDALSPFLDAEKEPVYPEEISSTKKQLSQGQIIVSRLRSYLKEIALVIHTNGIPMVASTEFIVLQPNGQMNVETLMVYLRSILPQTIFKWSQDGSNHPRFDEKELLNLRVPDVLLEHQSEIAQIIQESIACRQKANNLLEAAKRAVEIAIEDSEEAAMQYLQPFVTEGN